MTSSVSAVDVASPPMTTVANGGQISFSRPVVRARGQRPAIVVHVVISTGRVRSRTAARAAAPAVHDPSRTRCCMRSTSRMAGLTVSPRSATAPTIAIMPAGIPASTSAHVAPSTVSGSDSSTRIGEVIDSNVTASTARRRSTIAISARRNQSVDSSALSASIV